MAGSLSDGVGELIVLTQTKFYDCEEKGFGSPGFLPGLDKTPAVVLRLMRSVFLGGGSLFPILFSRSLSGSVVPSQNFKHSSRFHHKKRKREERREKS